MTSPWSVPVFTNLTIPSSAGPGQARIVIASQLPPPLDTYTTVSGPFSGAIIFYSNGDDTTYNFIGVVEDSIAQFALIQVGSVVAGTVEEFGPGVPMSLQLGALLTNVVYTIYANRIELASSGGITIDAASTLTLSGLIAARVLSPFIINDTIDWNGATTTESEDLAGVATVSAAYVQLGAIGHTFVAPPNGVVMVHHNAGLDNVVAGNAAYCAFEIRVGAVVGAGAVVFPAVDAYAIQLQGQDQIRAGRSKRVTGLTPGTTYNVSLWQRSSVAGNNVAFADRVVSVVPVL